MLNLGRLRVLCEVVQRGSFSAAAESLSYTQSAVSQAIARLEAETGATLIVRDRRGVRPTDAGATLIAHAQEIFARVEAAEADLGAVLGLRSGKLRVASFPSAGATLMPPFSLTLQESEPRLGSSSARSVEASSTVSSPAASFARTSSFFITLVSPKAVRRPLAPDTRSMSARLPLYANVAKHTRDHQRQECPLVSPQSGRAGVRDGRDLGVGSLVLHMSTHPAFLSAAAAAPG